MPRRLGSSVPATVSRLLQGGFLQSSPAWFGAVGSVAPLRPSLTRKIPKQGKDDNNSSSHASSSRASSSGQDPYAWRGAKRLSTKDKKSMKYSPPKPEPIQGLELHDKVRRMFFADHPFEAFRGIDLVEQDGVDDGSWGPKGEQWTELRQRSWNPSPDECVPLLSTIAKPAYLLPCSCVAFVLNLHQAHGIPLALAYQTGISQFQSLRASYEVSLHSAQVEMQTHGFEWPTEFSSLDRLTRAEDQNILNVLKDKNRPGVNAAVTSSASGSGISAGSLLNPSIPRERPQWTSGRSYFGGKLPSSGGSDVSVRSRTSGSRKQNRKANTISTEQTTEASPLAETNAEQAQKSV